MSASYALLPVTPISKPHDRVFTNPLPSKRLLVSVIVPVKNEAVHLPQTLDGLRLQQDDQGHALHPEWYEVLVLVNNSNDGSYRIACDYQAAYPDFRLLIAEMVFAEKVAHIGTVRRRLMDEAHDRLLSVGRENGIIASTDGDTIVDSQWVFQIICEMNQGIDAVGGRIIVNNPDVMSKMYVELNDQYRSLVAQAESLIDPVFHDPWPRHFQYYGANLAITCSMYEKVGRLPSIPFLEDEALHKALIAKDARIRKSPAVKVFTSSRLNGRVAVGLSEQLCVWKRMMEQHREQYDVCAEDVIARARQRKLLRSYWERQNQQEPLDVAVLVTIAGLLQVSQVWLQEQIDQTLYFGALWQSLESFTAETNKLQKKVPINEAIQGLIFFTENFPSEADHYYDHIIRSFQ